MKDVVYEVPKTAEDIQKLIDEVLVDPGNLSAMQHLEHAKMRMELRSLYRPPNQMNAMPRTTERLPDGKFYEVEKIIYTGTLGGRVTSATLDLGKLDLLTPVSVIKLNLLLQGRVQGNKLAYIIEEGLADVFEMKDEPKMETTYGVGSYDQAAARDWARTVGGKLEDAMRTSPLQTLLAMNKDRV